MIYSRICEEDDRRRASPIRAIESGYVRAISCQVLHAEFRRSVNSGMELILNAEARSEEAMRSEGHLRIHGCLRRGKTFFMTLTANLHFS
jgi:hypothetical protein